MRLGNLLRLPGGVHEQGRTVRFSLRYADGRIPSTREVEGVMLPLSEVAIHRVRLAAAGASREEGAQLPEALEYIIRFLQASLRDPGDLGAPLIEDERDLQLLRDGLVAPQYEFLSKEYERLIATEYPSKLSPEDEADLDREAGDFSVGTQDAQS